MEEELWKALNKARLVFPVPNTLLKPQEPNWEGCDYSKCGRTDKGVSAFGQVIGVRVRSNGPIQQANAPAPEKGGLMNGKEEEAPVLSGEEPATSPIEHKSSASGSGQPSPISATVPSSAGSAPFDPVDDEIPYCQVLNRLLPPDIRILAWCPNPPPNFSARFSCRERQYKYFFTQPAFTPTIGSAGISRSSNALPTDEPRREGWLDISAMRYAARKFVGLHDFRNFCKIDPSKQIENFQRRIFHADIEEVNQDEHPLGYLRKPAFSQYRNPTQNQTSNPSPPSFSPPTIYAFTLHGSAFLWHQVRHMVSILFLIGQGLESPSLIDTLLSPHLTPRKPQYEMADDAPLVLWDCLFPNDETHPGKRDALEWVYAGDYTGREKGVERAGGRKGDGKFGRGGVVDEMWRVWRGRKMDEILAGGLLDVIVGQGNGPFREHNEDVELAKEGKTSQKVFYGGDGPRLVGRYVPIMEKPLMESVEVQNAKYAKRKGFEEREEVREQGFRRVGVGVELEDTTPE